VSCSPGGKTRKHEGGKVKKKGERNDRKKMGKRKRGQRKARSETDPLAVVVQREGEGEKMQGPLGCPDPAGDSAGCPSRPWGGD